MNCANTTPLEDRSDKSLVTVQESLTAKYMLMVDRYDNVLRNTMDILAPVKSRTIVLRPNAPWYKEDIGNEKRKKRRLERRGRSSRLESDRLSYIEQCSVVNTMLYKAKEFYYSSVIRDNAHDTRFLFRSIDKLLQRQTEGHYPSADNDQQLANDFSNDLLMIC